MNLPTSIQLAENQSDWVRQEASRTGLSTPIILRNCVQLAIDMQLQENAKREARTAHIKAQIERKAQHEH